MEFLNKLQQVVSGKIEHNKPLAPLTTIKIGGPAKYFYATSSPEDIIKLLKLCEKSKIKVFILGNGSDLIVSDDGFDGLVIKIINEKVKTDGNFVEAGAGAPLNRVVGKAISNGLVGLGWATGIPGTIGGAVWNNAGAYGSDMAELVRGVTVIRRGKLKFLKNKKCKFGYRDSIFKSEKNNDIIWSVKFEFKKGDIVQEKQKVKEISGKRKEKFNCAFTAGSIFKNVIMSDNEIKDFKEKFPQVLDAFLETKIIPAGWLIDQCGLKGKKIGDAQISERHAGIIVNTGQAKAKDVIMLISIIKQKVRTKFNIQLVEEVVYVGI